jgi:AbrB family looped-hinge helix DNA binding protein
VRQVVIEAKLTSKGQLTLPKKIRERLGVHPGESVGFEEKEGQLVIRKVLKKSAFDKWAGKLWHLKGQGSDNIVREARGHDDGDRHEHSP